MLHIHNPTLSTHVASISPTAALKDDGVYIKEKKVNIGPAIYKRQASGHGEDRVCASGLVTQRVTLLFLKGPGDAKS